MLDRTAVPPGPLDILAAKTAPCPAAEFVVLPTAAKIAFRAADEAAIGKVAETFGVALPREACRSTTSGGRTALWLGPDEWMLTATGEDGGDIVAALEAVLVDVPHALVDVSDRSLAFAIEGALAETVLSSGCPLDLALSAFPVGMCTRTVLAKSEITLRRTAETAFAIDVWRSFAPYVWGVLEEARREYR